MLFALKQVLSWGAAAAAVSALYVNPVFYRSKFEADYSVSIKSNIIHV